MTVYFKELGKYGRLGNCFFQMAATIGAAKKFGDNYRFPYQPWFEQLGIAGTWAAGGPIPSHVPTYNEPHFHFAPISKSGAPGQPMNLHGYFQSEKYFAHCKDEIQKMLMPEKVTYRAGYTALHVRRDDYLKHKDCYHILNRPNYYDRAMSLVSGPFLIFSDDLAWCKQEFKGPIFEFSEERDPVKDLSNMIGCDHIIMANSSFSWWAAWLNPNLDKRVFAPNQWFGPKLAPSHNTKDLIPESWTKI